MEDFEETEYAHKKEAGIFKAVKIIRRWVHCPPVYVLRKRGVEVGGAGNPCVKMERRKD